MNIWKIKLFTRNKATLYLHFTTCLFYLLIYIDIISDKARAPFLLPTFLALISALALREFSRSLVSIFFLKANPSEIIIYPLGIYVENRDRLNRFKAIIYTLIGSFTNSITALILFNYLDFSNFTLTATHSFPTALAHWSVFIAAVQLLPVYPFDGLTLLKALLKSDDSSTALKNTLRIEWFIVLALALIVFLSADSKYLLVFINLIIPYFLYSFQNKAIAYAKPFNCKDAMLPFDNMTHFPHNFTISSALEKTLKTPQTLFPVFNGTNFIGLILRDTLLNGVFNLKESYITEITERELRRISFSAPLTEALTMFDNNRTPIVVEENGTPIGIITTSSLSEFLMIRETQRVIKESDYLIDDEI